MYSRIRTYFKITNVMEIAERYLVLNGFDGLYTMMGIIVGSYVAGHHDPSIVLASGLSGIVALGISGSATAYVSEKAMREKELKNLEGYMLLKLDKTIHKDAGDFAALFSSLVNGFSPVFAASIMAIPFIMAKMNLMNVEDAFKYSLIIGGIEVFTVGAYLGKISKESKMKYGFRMLAIAFIAAAVSYSVGSLLS